MPTTEAGSVDPQAGQPSPQQIVEPKESGGVNLSLRRFIKPLALSVAAIVLAPLLFASGVWARYEYVTKPVALKAAGPIHLGIMKTSVPAESILPPAEGAANAAFHYVLALSNYNRRRAPFIARRGLSPYIQEPPISADDLNQLALGASQNSCDFYEVRNGQPRFVFYILPDEKKWPFRPGIDPFELRPYTGPMRALAQSALNWGKDQERAGHVADAVRVYRNVSRFGINLRSKPGSMLDIELGLEIESRSLHYLETLYKDIKQRKDEEICHAYASSVSQLQQDVRAKFAQLGNPEAAKEVLLHDDEPVWRITAAVALVSAEHYHLLDPTEAWSAKFALRRAKRDPNRYVREACFHLAAMKDSDFRSPEVQQGDPE